MNNYAYMSTKFFINKSRVNHPRDISVSIGPAWSSLQAPGHALQSEGMQDW